MNTKTHNLLRLNSVSPCQPADGNTLKCKVFLGLACQLAYSWEVVTIATPDVASQGVVAACFQFHASLSCKTRPPPSVKTQWHRGALTQNVHQHLAMNHLCDRLLYK